MGLTELMRKSEPPRPQSPGQLRCNSRLCCRHTTLPSFSEAGQDAAGPPNCPSGPWPGEPRGEGPHLGTFSVCHLLLQGLDMGEWGQNQPALRPSTQPTQGPAAGGCPSWVHQGEWLSGLDHQEGGCLDLIIAHLATSSCSELSQRATARPGI